MRVVLSLVCRFATLYLGPEQLNKHMSSSKRTPGTASLGRPGGAEDALA